MRHGVGPLGGEIAAVGAGLLLAVAGCSQENPPPSDPVPTQGPAEAFFEAALGFSAEEAAQQSVLMEESIARCMLEQGFEYVPFTSGYHDVDWSQVDPPPGTREFAERFGYGYAAPPEGTVVTLPDANPNDAILEEMSPAEFEVYERALWGFTGDEAADGGVEMGGCMGAARDEVFGDVDDPVRVALVEEIARIDAEVAPMDPAVLEAVAVWGRCMDEADHPGYDAPPDAEADAWDRWVAFNDAIGTDPELGVADSDGRLVGEEALVAAEIALATADWDCRAAAGYDAVWQRARHRLQQDYVDANRAELDAWVEANS